ncbi:MAG TPA: PhzF family phenazine biosynthesis protein [Cycloclasticus sp.]|jgi:trans-2,3-dihydro-3-hydroxyanthranilate isomerase|nr:PhzF family phenazine biosynthesis protein [Cycloclasticus sp.]HIL94216.1 PhzF family phenazine biosynthesis protein [Cycloclasticus sp.]
MSHTYYTLDVFTDTPFQGAQIAVFPQAEKLDESRLAVIAKELNLSETTFIFPGDSGTFQLRTFSPRGEIDFAGHPVLAAGRVLAETGQITLSDKNTAVIFKQNSQQLTANITQTDDNTCPVQFTLQSDPVIDRYTPSKQEIAAILSLDEGDIDHSDFQPLLVSCGLPYLVIPVRSQDIVQKACFDEKAWGQSSAPSMAAQEIILFTNKTKTADTNFHARLLGPNISLHEDPPIGSTMPSFTGYLAWHEHIREGTYTFTIDRGTKQTRRSLLNIEMDKHAGRALTLRVEGQSVLISKNSLLIL